MKPNLQTSIVGAVFKLPGQEERSLDRGDGPLRFSSTEFRSLWTKCLWLSPVVGKCVFELDFQWLGISFGFCECWFWCFNSGREVFLLFLVKDVGTQNGNQFGKMGWKVLELSFFSEMDEMKISFLNWDLVFLREKYSIYKDITGILLFKKAKYLHWSFEGIRRIGAIEPGDVWLFLVMNIWSNLTQFLLIKLRICVKSTHQSESLHT